MEVLLASVTLQVSVDDWPRSIEEGSAENEPIVGAAGAGGAGVVVGAGAGGGGGTGCFFLQPARNTANNKLKQTIVILRLFNMN
jgi:hypothetical protein